MANPAPTGESTRKKALAYLQSIQTADGFWPYLQGHDGAIEPSCWAAIATRSEKNCRNKFLKHILDQQNSDGGWSSDATRLNSDWTTAIALMSLRALIRCSIDESFDLGVSSDVLDQARKRAFNWLIENRCEHYTPTARFALLLWKGPEYDYERGWPWNPDTFDWVEPTSYALMAMREPEYSSEKSARIALLAEKYLLSVSCPKGGWNCGDRNPLGVVIPADMQFSALALLALKTRENEEAVKRSLRFLQERKMESRAEYAWAALALKRYKMENSYLLEKLTAEQSEDGSLAQNVTTHAIACLSFEPGLNLQYL